LSTVERNISILEKEIAEIDHNLLMNYDATIAKDNFFEKYQQKKADLEKLMNKWEQITIELERVS